MTAVLRRFEGPDALAVAAADELGRIVHEAVASRGTCSIALAGGSTPKRLFEVLVARGRGALPWAQVELWWGDERAVPPDHAKSNYGMARDALIDPLGLDLSRVHRVLGELAVPEAAARVYEDAMVAALGAPPVLDLVLLGLGTDGHTASLFPGSPALAERTRWVVATVTPGPLVDGSSTRLTLTARAINAARQVRFVVSGADKAVVLAAVLDGPHDPQRYPAQLVAPLTSKLTWLVDHAAASRLGGRATREDRRS